MDHPRDPGTGQRPPLSKAGRATPKPSSRATPNSTTARLLRAGETLRRWLRPPRTLRPTRAGWSFFAITFGVGFAALNTGNNLLYLVLSLMLAFLVLSGALSESALRGIQVQRRIPRELFAGAPGSIGLVVSNRQRRVPAFALVIEDRLRTADGEIRPAGRAFALRVGPESAELRSYRLVPELRGELNFEGFQVYTRFPFGLFSKSLSLDVPGSTLVYPRVDAIDRLRPPAPARDAGEAHAGARGSGALVAGLRDWEPGDAMRRIHWPSSLRRRALCVREQERETQTEVEIALETAGRLSGERFERCVDRAASEVVAFLDAGSRVALRTDTERFPADSGARQRSRLLAFLARVEPGAVEAT